MNGPLRIFLAGLVLLSGISPAWPSDVKTKLEDGPPQEGLLFTFSNPEFEDALTWSGVDGERRDIGMSFRIGENGNLRKITLHLHSAPAFMAPAKFRLQLFETQALGEQPDAGQEVFSGLGELTLQPDDRDRYVTFELPENIPVTGGSYYTFLLTFETSDKTHYATFRTNQNYGDGLLWYRNAESEGELRSLNQTDRPGWVIFIH